MESMKIIKDKLKKFEQQKDYEKIRFDLYSLYTHIILTKDYFNKNSDMEAFLNSIGITCKPYLLKSRTMILGKVLRKIQKEQEKDLNIFVSQLNELIKISEENVGVIEENNINNTIEDNKERKTTNYMNEILKRYSRTGK